MWDWSDYDTESGTEDVPLLISRRTQQLFLAAINSMQYRQSWEDVNDATWDDIEEALAEAIEEIIEEYTPPVTIPKGVMANRTTNQNIGSPVSTWNSIVFDDVGEISGDFGYSGTPISDFTIPDDGFYYVGMNIRFAANSSGDSLSRGCRIVKNDVPFASSFKVIVSQAIDFSISRVIYCEAGDVIKFQGFTQVTNLLALAVNYIGIVASIVQVR